MLETYKDGQPIAYNLIINSLINNKLSHAYLIETNNNSNSLDFVISFIKYVLCPNHYQNDKLCGKCSLCKRIDDNNYLELKIIEADGLWIKKNQILDLQKEFSTKAIEGNKKIYVIKDCDKMNSSTANTILKFLEEPEANIIAILITNNINKLLPTIISRCQIISLIKNIKKSNNTLENLASIICKSSDELNKFLDENKKIYENVLEFIEFYEKNKLDTIIYLKSVWHNHIKSKDDCDLAIDILINFYYDVLNIKFNLDTKIFVENNDLLQEISKKNDFDDIINKLQVFIETKELIRYNLNMNLLIDKMIIDLGGV